MWTVHSQLFLGRSGNFGQWPFQVDLRKMCLSTRNNPYNVWIKILLFWYVGVGINPYNFESYIPWKPTGNFTCSFYKPFRNFSCHKVISVLYKKKMFGQILLVTLFSKYAILLFLTGGLHILVSNCSIPCYFY